MTNHILEQNKSIRFGKLRTIWFLFSEFYEENRENNKILFPIFISCFTIFFHKILKIKSTENKKRN